ncbi:flippase-like domain-containing protein [Solirubrobacter sp. CPCC 204708]|uniref:lysylphosphatidylglycerol synthase domain-containing protein n=1 Tax=Solirubrobacter deserti TaxID=2282478 RepID=UPI001930C97B|nr:lysylphosphatidylglycerol synthase domain-containing protein [Solirubrobacter deserti]MBE2317432.1 flippase-like domain-containing protein [Solirubrobacter deserti]
MLVVLLCAGLALRGEIGKLETDGLRFELGWFLAAVLGFAALQVMHAALWRRSLLRLDLHLEPKRARAIWCTSALARYVPTSMLMPTMRIAMSERYGIPKRRCLASLVYEAALALAGALVVAGYFVVELPELEGHATRWLAVAIPLLAVVALHPKIFGPVSAKLLRRIGRDPLERLLPERVLVGLWAAYALSFVLAGLALFALAEALYPVGVSALPQVAGAFAVGFAVSVLAFVLPGGLGAREAGLAAALAPVMPTAIAIAVAIVVRLVQIAIEILFAATTPVIARRAEARAAGAQAVTDAEPAPELVQVSARG